MVSGRPARLLAAAGLVSIVFFLFAATRHADLPDRAAASWPPFVLPKPGNPPVPPIQSVTGLPPPEIPPDPSPHRQGGGGGDGNEQPIPNDASSPPASPPPPPPLPYPVALVPDAHRLPSADAFRSHFEAVTRLPGLTVHEAMRTCRWPADAPVNFQFAPDADWVARPRPDAEIAQRRREWQAFVEGGLIPYDLVRDRFRGRGLVVVAGNQDTLRRVAVLLRQLRRLGSALAVELHYWDDEMTADARARLAALYAPLHFNDLAGGHNVVRVRRDRFWINYQLKTAALLNSRFAEPLLLDSDNVPVRDPAALYEDAAVYAEYGTVFWPDIARTRPQNPAWALTNTPCREDEYEQESGQLLVDKTRYWYHLQLAWWLASDERQAPYYAAFLLGDKDLFRFAWHALKTAYGKPRRWLTSVGTLNANDEDGSSPPYYCGHSFAQYHPDGGEVAFVHGGLAKTVAPEVMRWNREARGGFFRHYKRAATDEDPSALVRVGIKFDGAAYMPDHSPEFHWSQCVDMQDVEARDLEELLPGWEETMEEIGGFWMLEEEEETGERKDGDGAADREMAAQDAEG